MLVKYIDKKYNSTKFPIIITENGISSKVTFIDFSSSKANQGKWF